MFITKNGHQHEENRGIFQPLFTVFKEYHSSSSLFCYDRPVSRENLKLFSGYIHTTILNRHPLLFCGFCMVGKKKNWPITVRHSRPGFEAFSFRWTDEEAATRRALAGFLTHEIYNDLTLLFKQEQPVSKSNSVELARDIHSPLPKILRSV